MLTVHKWKSTVHKFALPSFINSTGALGEPTVQIPNFENSSVVTRGVGCNGSRFCTACFCSFSPAEVGVASSDFSVGLQCRVGACGVRSRQLLSASGQRHGARLTMRTRSARFQVQQVSSAQHLSFVCSRCNCPATASAGTAQLYVSAGPTANSSAIRSRCSRSPLHASAGTASWTSLGSPLAA